MDRGTARYGERTPHVPARHNSGMQRNHFVESRTYVDRDRKSTCCESLCGAIYATCCGVALIFGCLIAAFFIERHYVTVEADIVQISKATKLQSDSSSYDIPLYFADTLKTLEGEGRLMDSELGISREALKMKRKVEIRQWKEKKTTKKRKNRDGTVTEETHYDYEQIWTDKPIDSSRFRYQDGHYNVGSLPFRSSTQSVSGVRMGRYTLGSEYLSELSGFRQANPQTNEIPTDYEIRGNYIYKPIGTQGGTDVGDVRISLSIVTGSGQTHTVFGVPEGDAMYPFKADSGYEYKMLAAGRMRFSEFVDNLRSSNSTTLYVLRFLDWLGLVIGFCSATSLITLLTSYLPCGVDRVANCVIYTVAVLVASILWLVVWFIAWFVARPMVFFGILLLVVLGWFGYSQVTQSSSRLKNE